MNKSQNQDVFSTFNFHRQAMHLSAPLGLFADWNDRFPTLSHIWSLAKGTPFVRSLPVLAITGIGGMCALCVMWLFFWIHPFCKNPTLVHNFLCSFSLYFLNLQQIQVHYNWSLLKIFSHDVFAISPKYFSLPILWNAGTLKDVSLSYQITGISLK